MTLSPLYLTPVNSAATQIDQWRAWRKEHARAG